MNVLITGSGRGLGLELVKEGVSRGHRILASYRTESRELERLSAEGGGRAILLPMDVASEKSVALAAKTAGGYLGELNGIVNNAAVLFGSKYSAVDPILSANLQEYEETYRINVFGPVLVLKYFMPFLYAAKGGRVVLNITSEGAALRPTGYHYASYASSKAALNSYTQRMRNYLRSKEDKRDIAMAMVHPGKMMTDMGVENGQIHPRVSALGIWDMLEKKTHIDGDIPFYDYTGKLFTLDATEF